MKTLTPSLAENLPIGAADCRAGREINSKVIQAADQILQKMSSLR